MVYVFDQQYVAIIGLNGTSQLMVLKNNPLAPSFKYLVQHLQVMGDDIKDQLHTYTVRVDVSFDAVKLSNISNGTLSDDCKCVKLEEWFEQHSAIYQYHALI